MAIKVKLEDGKIVSTTDASKNAKYKVIQEKVMAINPELFPNKDKQTFINNTSTPSNATSPSVKLEAARLVAAINPNLEYNSETGEITTPDLKLSDKEKIKKSVPDKFGATYSNDEPLVKVSTAPLYYISSEGYYLSMDAGRVLFLKPKEDYIADTNFPTILRKPLDNQGGSGMGVIKSSITPQAGYKGWLKPQGANLTQAELDNIIQGKPSVDALLDVYDQYSNDSINIDISKAIPVW